MDIWFLFQITFLLSKVPLVIALLVLHKKYNDDRSPLKTWKSKYIE